MVETTRVDGCDSLSSRLQHVFYRMQVINKLFVSVFLGFILQDSLQGVKPIRPIYLTNNGFSRTELLID